MRSILRGHFCRPFTIRAGRFGAFRDGLVQTPDGGGIDHIQLSVAGAKIADSPPEAGVARYGNHPVQHLPDGAQTAATIPQRRQMTVPLGAVHMTQGRMIEFCFSPKGSQELCRPIPMALISISTALPANPYSGNTPIAACSARFLSNDFGLAMAARQEFWIDR
jgi:hypothetical protein